MESVVLPPEIEEIHRRLRRTYRTEFDTLRLRGRELKILQVADIEPLLAGQDPFADVSNFPFWVRLWESALILADLMMSQPPVTGRRLLELGAGLGAPGLAAACRGYQVTLSDYEKHILEFQKVSAAANSLNEVEFRLIDWLNPPHLPRFDTIIGAEILFRAEFFQPLLQIFQNYLAPGGTIYLAHDSERQSLAPFLKMAAEHFDIGTMARKIAGDDKEVTVVLNRLQFNENRQRSN